MVRGVSVGFRLTGNSKYKTDIITKTKGYRREPESGIYKQYNRSQHNHSQVPM